MKSFKTFILFTISFFLIYNSHAQEDYVKITPPEFEGALNNPLKGFRQDINDIGKRPYDAIVRTYIKWNELERNKEDGIVRIQEVCNQKWSGLAENNTKVIPRVYLDWDSKTGNEYWPEDMETGDYTSEQFKQRLEELVTKLGKAWDNDSRIAWIQMGIIGYWGEQHHPKPNAWQQQLLGNLFTKAFKNKKVLVRRPFETFEEYEFGWYWDRFAHFQQAIDQGEVMLQKYPDRWKTEPMEGEVGYGANVGDKQPGDSPNETLRDPYHRKWLIDWIRKVHCTGLGWISDYSLNDSEVRAGADEVQKAFGYRYILKEVTYPKTIHNKQSFSVSFDVENVGSAPFYYDWPVELRLLDPESHEVKWRQVFNDVDIRDWMPGESWNADTRQYDLPAPTVKNEATFAAGNTMPAGKYILALAILDPAGMEPSVKFATQQYFNGGNHPIGYVGVETNIEETTVDPSVFDDPSKDNSLHYTVENKLQSSFGGINRKIPGKIEAENSFDNSGFELEECEDIGGGLNTAFADDGDYLDYLVYVSKAGTYRVNFRVAALNGEPQILLMNSYQDRIVANKLLKISETGGWQNWETQSVTAALPEGKMIIRIFSRAGEYNLNWFSFDLLTDAGNIRSENQIQVYPVPADKSINVRLGSSGRKVLAIYNLQGKKILEFSTTDQLISLNTDHYPAGLYVLKCVDNEIGESVKFQITHN